MAIGWPCSSVPPFGRTCCSSSASSCTCPTRSTCTSWWPPSMCSSRARAGAGASSPLTSSSLRPTSVSAPRHRATSPGSSCSNTMSCTECGRCQDACPAYNTGKELSPKLLIMALRDQVRAQSNAALVPNAVTDNVVWDCVTCGACVQECPVGIEHIDHIVDLRRNLVMVESRFPEEAGTMLRDVDRASNPWGRAQADRTAWADGLDVRVLQPGEPPPEVLFWVGCAPAFDERAKQGARSTAKLLRQAGVDFAILGQREACTGDPARRMGDEYTYQRLAKQNVETLNESRVKRIVTTCPHCFNTIGNEYPDFGGRYEVVHHTEFLAELVRDGKLAPLPSDRTITYHDP